MHGAVVDAKWQGPFAWPGIESDLPSVPAVPGVYLLTVDHRGGYLIYAAGITRRPVPERLREHTRQYRDGVYNVLDIEAMRAGTRREIWHGFWMKERPAERMAEFAARRPAIGEAVERQLTGFRVFVADVGTRPRVLERIEAAVMNHLYAQPPPFCDVPDRGMMLAPRWRSEGPITMRSTCAHLLHTLPAALEI